MTVADSEVSAVTAYAERELPLETAALGEEYYYQSLPLCVIDAVFSIGVRYAGVEAVVRRYCEFFKQRRIRASEALPPAVEQETISVFCDRAEQSDASAMARRVYANRQRTSSRNGVLKAEAALRFAKCLRAHGVEVLQDVPRVVANRQFEADVRAIPGQTSGISLTYFWMLCGSDELIKPDRMVLRFLRQVLSRDVTLTEAQALLTSACTSLQSRFSKLTPRLLDHVIWKRQRLLEVARCPKN